MNYPTISRTGVYGVAKQHGKVLLVKQYKGPHQGKWDLPGGQIEAGETVEEALKREFREEVGMDFRSLEWLANTTATTEGIDPQGALYLLHQIGLLYRIEGLEVLPNQKPEMEYDWIDPKKQPDNHLSPFVKYIISPFLYPAFPL